MRDIIQDASDTDKQVTLALLRSVWLSYLLSIGSIWAGALSIFSVAAIVKTEPAQANITEQPASLAQSVEEEPASHPSSHSSAQNCSAGANQAVVNGEPFQTAEGDFQTLADIKRSQHTSFRLNLKDSDAVVRGRAPAMPSVALTANADAPYVATAALSELQDLCVKDDAKPEYTDAIHRVFTSQPGEAVLAPTLQSSARIPVFTPPSQTQATQLNLASPELAEAQPRTVAAVNAAVSANPSSLVSTRTTTDNGNLLAQVPAEDKPTTTQSAIVPSPPTAQPELNSVERNVSQQLAQADNPTTGGLGFAPSSTVASRAINSIERNVPEQLAQGDKPTTAQPAWAPDATATQPTPHRGPGGASLLGSDIQAQSSGKEQEPSSDSQNTLSENDPLAPTLLLQGGFITQGETGARARLTGLYPISPNALFGGTVDLITGEGFSDSDGTGLDLNELYFTGSLPSYPNLRLTVGLIDLTSYFDRNSFAKDSLTHFFNPVFQTNPALAAAGIGSRPGVLLNWDITDNIQARAAAFSSSRNLGDFDLDAYAGELAFRFGNGIIRGTFASDRDAGRGSGFEEIFQINRGNGEFGPLSNDRENAYGINAEYFIPEINMGVFGRYGHYENTSLGEGGETYSLGLNFLDLFMPDDRLGFGYGRNLSNDDLRRASGGKVPDVWELFYDFRILPNLRAGVTLQARDEFSDVVAGFRVKTEFDVLGELFR